MFILHGSPEPFDKDVVSVTLPFPSIENLFAYHAAQSLHEKRLHTSQNL
ncbi:MAG: hypothetical protein WCK32_09795 [Chlorobiaceae bacterium]